MAVGLPGSKLAITPVSAFGRTRPVLSGESADDLTLGQRGLVQNINYCYATRGRCLFSLSQWATPGSLAHGAYWFSTSSTASYVQCTGYVPVVVGADVAALTIIADGEGIALRLVIEGGATGTGAAVVGRGDITGTLALSSTGALSIGVEALSGGGVAKLYSLSVFETSMTAGDFP